MALANYTDLQTSIADFLNRDDLTTVIPTFITLTEADMNRSIRHWRMENRASASINSQYSAIPTDFLEPIRLHIESGPYQPLDLISSSDMQQRRAATSDAAGKPQFYAFTQGELEFYPTPNASYDLEMNYYAQIPALSTSITSNWVLEYFPDAYLYGSLVHSAPYLAEDARANVWASLYKNAVDGILLDGDKSKYGGSGLRMRLRAY